MTINEASERYNIPMKILKEYESWGLCSEVKKVMGSWHYDQTDIERLSLIMTLHDVGFTNEEVEHYMRLALSENETSEERMSMLRKKRNGTLDEIHFKQKQLDRLDYLRYEISPRKRKQMKGWMNPMKKEIGKALALYPTPLVVVGTMVDEKPNYVLVGHLGIIGHDRIMVSLAKPHYTNKGIKQTHHLTVNMVSEAMLPKADHVGCVSGNTESKAQVFAYHTGKTGTPIVDESPLVMECEVADIYETEGFESFICKIIAVHAEESILDSNGKIDYNRFKPVLFEMPTYKYLRTGEVIGDCMKQH